MQPKQIPVHLTCAIDIELRHTYSRGSKSYPQTINNNIKLNPQRDVSIFTMFFIYFSYASRILHNNLSNHSKIYPLDFCYPPNTFHRMSINPHVLE